MPTVLVMFALLAAAQEPSAHPADAPEVTVTDIAPLAHPFTEPAELPPVILPVRRMHLDASGNLVLERPGRPQSSFWAEIGIAAAHTRICDPFGRLGTECANGTGPSAFASIGGARFRLNASGALFGSTPEGRDLRVSLRGTAAAMGPVRIGLALEGVDLVWSRPIFAGGTTELGTERRLQAAFMGIDAGWGDYNRVHARIVILPGYWKSTYHGTLRVPGYTGAQALALDEFVLARLRLEAGNIPLGPRVTLSGNVQRTWPHFVGHRTTASPAVPRVEWSGGIRASARIWGAHRFGFRLFSEVRLSNTDLSLLDSRAFVVGTSLRFR